MTDLNEHPADSAANPVVGMVWDDPGPRQVPRHAHRRGQLIYSERGCVTVEVEDALFILPPNRAVWIPPELPHSATYKREVAFRGIFIAPEVCDTLPARCAIVQVNPLVRELIAEAARKPWDYIPDGPDARLMRVLIDQLVLLPTSPLRLPDAQSPRLRRVMVALRDDPADTRPVSAWADLAHLSIRTFTRNFRAETGMTFSTWRQQLRLISAIERLAAGESVTRIAYDLGYRTTSSFTAMFRRALGVAPSTYFDPRKDG